ncbi:hypothetical protein [Companilactobacillus hulinensis]|uniref:hypothetical protein n=1 Tax=Companilactobacillus hulinensis TaxID=2486007 RepID=UPI000F766CFF|nr:hypothetical protein [Companilactobacillus hulinensis]
MKKKTIISMILALLLMSFSSLHYNTVQAESVTGAGYLAEVSSNPGKLYNSTGESIGKSLPDKSNWKVGRILDQNDGSELFRVGYDEYLSSKDSYLYQLRPEIIEVEDSSGEVDVYSHSFVESTSVALKSDTYWYSDTVIYTSSGMPFVRVAPNEYVPMYEVISQSFTEAY